MTVDQRLIDMKRINVVIIVIVTSLGYAMVNIAHIVVFFEGVRSAKTIVNFMVRIFNNLIFLNIETTCPIMVKFIYLSAIVMFVHSWPNGPQDLFLRVNCEKSESIEICNDIQ